MDAIIIFLTTYNLIIFMMATIKNNNKLSMILKIDYMTIYLFVCDDFNRVLLDIPYINYDLKRTCVQGKSAIFNKYLYGLVNARTLTRFSLSHKGL